MTAPSARPVGAPESPREPDPSTRDHARAWPRLPSLPRFSCYARRAAAGLLVLLAACLGLGGTAQADWEREVWSSGVYTVDLRHGVTGYDAGVLEGRERLHLKSDKFTYGTTRYQVRAIRSSYSTQRGRQELALKLSHVLAASSAEATKWKLVMSKIVCGGRYGWCSQQTATEVNFDTKLVSGNIVGPITTAPWGPSENWVLRLIKTESGTRPHGARPGAPTNVTVTAVSDSALDVTWTPPQNGAAPVHTYLVQHCTQWCTDTGGGVWSQPIWTSYPYARIDGLAPRTQAYVRVIARSDASGSAAPGTRVNDYSEWSAIATGTTMPEAFDWPRLEVTLKPLGTDPSRMVVEWSPAEPEIEKYEIRYRGASDVTFGTTQSPGAVIHWRGANKAHESVGGHEVGPPWLVLDGPGARYVIERPVRCADTIVGRRCSPTMLGTHFAQVRPWRDGRPGPWSMAAQGLTADCQGHCQPSERPRAPTARTSPDGTSVTVSWRAPSTVETIEAYEVRWREAGRWGRNDGPNERGWTSMEITGEADSTAPPPTSLELGEDLVLGTAYEFQVRARTVWEDWSPWSDYSEPGGRGGTELAVLAGFQSDQPMTCPGGIQESAGTGDTDGRIECLIDIWTAASDWPHQPRKNVVGWSVRNRWQEDIELVHSVDVDWIGWAGEASAPSATLSSGERVTIHPRWTEAARTLPIGTHTATLTITDGTHDQVVWTSTLVVTVLGVQAREIGFWGSSNDYNCPDGIENPDYGAGPTGEMHCTGTFNPTPPSHTGRDIDWGLHNTWHAPIRVVHSANAAWIGWSGGGSTLETTLAAGEVRMLGPRWTTAAGNLSAGAHTATITITDATHNRVVRTITLNVTVPSGGETPVPRAPEILLYELDSTIRIAWTEPEGASRYQVRWGTTGTDVESLDVETVQAASFETPTLTPQVTHIFQVRAGSADAWGPWSEPVEGIARGQPGQASPPTARAGADLEGVPGEVVTLEGTTSTNPHGQWWEMEHRWTQTAGPGVSLSDATVGDPTFTVPEDATTGTAFEFTLTVTDTDGESDSDAMTVTVKQREETITVSPCTVDLGTLSPGTAATRSDERWDNPDCRAHHQADSRARYFAFTLTAPGVVSLDLAASPEGALYVSRGTPQNAWGTVPRATYTHRVSTRLANGKLVHAGTPRADAVLQPAQYMVEAVAPSTGAGAFTVSIAVQALPAMSVADARGVEGADATLTFEVTLSNPSPAPVTVRFATSDGTAVAGEDYTATAGSLSFAANDTMRTITVPILDDAHDEGEETLSLTLSEAQGATLEDALATGTIANSDPLMNAWLARFGRTVASQTVDALEARFETPGGSGSHVTIAGRHIALDADGAGAQGAGALGPRNDDWMRPGGDGPEEDGTRTALEKLANGASDGTAADALGATVGAEELLLGSSFHLSTGGGASGGATLSAWGRASLGHFESTGDVLPLEGRVTTGMVGLDAEHGDWLGGVALSHSAGDGTLRPRGLAMAYDVESTITAVHPYVRRTLSRRLFAWATAGVGRGSLTLTQKREETDEAPAGRTTWETGTAMHMAAAGARGVLVEAPEDGGLALALKGDAFWVRTTSERVEGVAGLGNLAAGDARATRVRVGLEATRETTLGSDVSEVGARTLTPSLEVGLRHDGGDAETGAGLELGAGLRYASPAGLSMDVRTRILAAHEDGDYREWGVSGALRLEPGTAGRGLSFNLTPAWGAGTTSTDRLWGAGGGNARLGAGEGHRNETRLESEIGYGMAGPWNTGTATPYAGVVVSQGHARRWTSGVRWTLEPGAAMTFEGTREERSGERADHALIGRIALSW